MRCSMALSIAGRPLGTGSAHKYAATFTGKCGDSVAILFLPRPFVKDAPDARPPAADVFAAGEVPDGADLRRGAVLGTQAVPNAFDQRHACVDVLLRVLELLLPDAATFAAGVWGRRSPVPGGYAPGRAPRRRLSTYLTIRNR